MAEQIRVNYAALEDMARHCSMVAQKLQALASNSKTWAGQMQNGALQGGPGETFVGALGVLSQKVQKLGDAFTQESADIHGAMNDMRLADSKASSNFGR
jgi:uncharacterized protein YukE